MATTSWQLSGDYCETCSCDFLCPCAPSNLAAQPTKGSCHFAMVFHIDQGRYGNLTMDGLNFAVVGSTPTVMSQGKVTIPSLLEQAVAGVSSVANPSEPLYIDNTLHPANPRLALGRATQSHLHAFGLAWDDTSGQNNGYFAPFHWQN